MSSTRNVPIPGLRTLLVAAATLSAPSAMLAGDFGVHNGLPDGMPPAAYLPEPHLPAPEAWPFAEAFPKTSGTGRLQGGAFFWSDFIYDDTGQGNFTYAAPDAAANGADIFRAAIGIDADATHWRVDFNTLVNADVPVVAWALDTDANASTGSRDWPGDAGVTSAGLEKVIIVSSRGAWLHDLENGSVTDLVSEGATLDVDMDARAFVLSIPRDALAVSETWTVRLAAGVANEEGDGFAQAPEAEPGSAFIYNAAFRGREDEPFLVGGFGHMSTNWNNGAQSEALSAGDVSDFAIDIVWSHLRAEVETPEELPTGFSTRWYVSSQEIAQGLNPAARGIVGPPLGDAQYWGRVQPYTVYVPTDYDPISPAPLTLLLHSGDRNHNGFGSATQDDVYMPMCEDRGSICVTPLARGGNTWYLNEGERDVFEVWNRLADTYALDPDRTVVSGWSMGGVGTTRFATNYPHLFTGAAIISGAGYYNAQGRRDQEGDELRAENLANLATFINSGPDDVAYGNTQRWDAGLEAAKVSYRANYYTDATHGDLGEEVGWSDVAQYLETNARALEKSPDYVVFRWEPGDARADLGLNIDRAYWLKGLQPRDAGARWSRIEAGVGIDLDAPMETEMEEGTFDLGHRTVDYRMQTATIASGSTSGMALDLANVATATVDLDQAGYPLARNASLTVSTDGPVNLMLTRRGAVQRISLDADAMLTAPSVPLSIRAVSEEGQARLEWSSDPADPAPAREFVVTTEDGAVICLTRTTSCSLGPIGEEELIVILRADNLLGSSAPTKVAVIQPAN